MQFSLQSVAIAFTNGKNWDNSARWFSHHTRKIMMLSFTPLDMFSRQKMTAEILLVDDNAIQATTRRAILERSGRSVAPAAGASEALGMLQDEQLLNSVGLIITDHLMPGFNGPQFVERVREQLPKIPILVLSGLADAEGEYDGMNVIFRVKPFPPDMLISLTNSILDEPISRSA